MSFIEKSEDYRIQSKDGTWRRIYKYSWTPYSYEVEGVKFEIGTIGDKRTLSIGPPFLPIIPWWGKAASRVQIYLHIISDSATVTLHPYSILVREDSSASPLTFFVTEFVKDTGSTVFNKESATLQKGQWREFSLRFKVPYDSLQNLSVDIGNVLINDHYIQVPIIELLADPSVTYIPFNLH